MKSWILRKATKKWLKRYSRKEMVPSIRAVFVGDFVSTEVILNECYDSVSLDFYCNKIIPSLSHASTALDIGANIGNHTAILAKHFDQVFAFEPNPQAALLLRANSINKSIKVIEKGVSDAQGSINFKLNYDNVGGSQIVNVESDIIVDVATLDDLSDQYDFSNVSFIKIDVEGHEAKVLAGAQNLLKSQHPVIALELHSSIIPNLAEQVNKEIQQAGYKQIYALIPDKQVKRWVPKMLRPSVTHMIPKPTSNITDEYGQYIISNIPL